MCVYLSFHICYQRLLHSGESLFGFREYIYFDKQNVGRNMNVRVLVKGSEGNGEHDIRH